MVMMVVDDGDDDGDQCDPLVSSPHTQVLIQVPMIDEGVEDWSLLPSKQELYKGLMMMMMMMMIPHTGADAAAQEGGGGEALPPAS